MSTSSCCGSTAPSSAATPEQAVLERYKAGAQVFEPTLCCAVEYTPGVVENLPAEIIEKDYGCGDPTRYVYPGERVVDLGSGAGKNCYILAQRVGAEGAVIGIDFNDEMLALSRKYQGEMAEKLGYKNVEFYKAKIQDLALDLSLVAEYLHTHPIASLEDWWNFEATCDRFRQERPLIPSNSIDVVVSNCVLNLVQPRDKKQLFTEIYRILKPGGRAIISDIVSDGDPTPEMIADPNLWSGCISGAFREDQFPRCFTEAGFAQTEVLVRQSEPWQVIQGIEFRSITLRADKQPRRCC
jgi:SAM-dependent methyltransferase